MSKLFLVDGHGFIFRAFYASPNLTTSENTPIGAINAFVQMIFKLLEAHNIKRIAVALDSGKSSHRCGIYEKYKGTRKSPPPELVTQFTIMREALDAFGIKYVEQEGTEADDIIASYTKFGIENGYQVTIVSSDKDLLQLLNISENVSIFDPAKDHYINREDVVHKFGIHPGQIADFLGLVGDVSDNVPGVKGIGQKTASNLLQEFNTIENIYQNLGNIKSERVKALLKENREAALLSKDLITLLYDIPATYNLEELAWQGFVINGNNIHAFLNKYELKRIASRYEKLFVGQQIINKCSNVIKDAIKTTYHYSNELHLTPQELESLWHNIQHVGHVFMEITVTDDTIPCFEKKLHSINFLFNSAFLKITDADDLMVNPASPIHEYVSKILSSFAIKKYCIDSKQLLHIFKQYNVELNAFDDLDIMRYSAQTLSPNPWKDEGELGEDNSCNTLIRMRNALDGLISRLHNQQQISLYYSIDMPLNQILAKMERLGMLIAPEILQSLQAEYVEKLRSIEKEVYDIAGETFNLASPKQLSYILFEKLKLPSYSRLKKDKVQYSTDSEALEKLSSEGYSVADDILKWRQIFKLNTTYVNGLLGCMQNHRIHTNFNSTLTSTGRLSSNSPNLQNIPIRTGEGMKLRRAFIASPGNLLLSADYSQIEIRILAHIAKIDSLQHALRNGQDIHVLTASQVFGVPVESVTDGQRQHAKAINFGIMYGISSFGLARNLRIPSYVAKDYIKRYFLQYSGIKEYMDNIILSARDNGYVKTLFNRRCSVPNIISNNGVLRKFGERAAINAPIQGTAADIIRKAMVTLPAEAAQYLCMQIHDELIFDIPENKVAKFSKIIKRTMSSAAALSIPLEVDLKIGKSLGEMDKVT